MLYHLTEYIRHFYDLPGMGLFRYISFRAGMAAFISLIIAIFIGKKIIKFLQAKLIGETIRDVGPESHKAKAGTPTMGGIIIILSLLTGSLLFADLTNAYVWLSIIAVIWMGFIGFIDDYIKVVRKNKKGLHGKAKIIGQISLGLIVGITMILHPDFTKKIPHIDYKTNKIKPNLYLKSRGFKKNDVLLKVENNKNVPTQQLDSLIAYSSYTVLRNNDTLTINIPVQFRKQTAIELFGQKDLSFITKTDIPFLKNYYIDYSAIIFWEKSPDNIWAKILYILIVIFIITAVSNAVNLTDGLDGLAIGLSTIVIGTLAIFAYVSGNFILSDYLHITFIPLSSELTILTAAAVGAGIGFLWYNSYPAQIFMGDTGSLMLGAFIAVISLMLKKELLLPLLCGVFFVETLSVIIQVSYFKYTKRKYGEGRRIFKMSPLHHHFELMGIPEPKIAVRFWIVGIILAILTILILKIR